MYGYSFPSQSAVPSNTGGQGMNPYAMGAMALGQGVSAAANWTSAMFIIKALYSAPTIV